MPCLPLHLSPSRALPLPCALSPFPPTRPLFIPFRSSSAHSFYPFRSFPLPFRSPTFVWPADNCIREAGYCVTANGGDQNTGVVSVGTMTEDACLSYTAPHILLLIIASSYFADAAILKLFALMKFNLTLINQTYIEA